MSQSSSQSFATIEGDVYQRGSPTGLTGTTLAIIAGVGALVLIGVLWIVLRK